MDDSWAFRTERGRAWLADGRLRLEGSVRGLLRQTHRERWRRNSGVWRVLLVASLAATAGSAWRAASAARSLVVSGSLGAGDWVLLAGFAVLAVALVREVRRSERVPTADVESVDRDGRSFRVAYADGGERREIEFEALTEADADEAADVLRLKGVPVDGNGGRERTRAVEAES